MPNNSAPFSLDLARAATSSPVSLFARSPCSPDERHTTDRRYERLAIVDFDRVYVGHLDVYVVVRVDPHNVGSRDAESLAVENTGKAEIHTVVVELKK